MRSLPEGDSDLADRPDGIHWSVNAAAALAPVAGHDDLGHRPRPASTTRRCRWVTWSRRTPRAPTPSMPSRPTPPDERGAPAVVRPRADPGRGGRLGDPAGVRLVPGGATPSTGGDPLYYHLEREPAGRTATASSTPTPTPDGLHVQAADHPPLYFMYLSVFSLLGMGTITWHLLASTLLGRGLDRGGRPGRARDRRPAGRADRGAAGGDLPQRLALRRHAAVGVDGHPDGAAVGLDWPTASGTHPSAWRLVVVGLVVGLGTLARSELVLMAPFLVRAARPADPRSGGPRSGPRTGSGAVAHPWRAARSSASAAFSAVVVPWVVFNMIRFDHPVHPLGEPRRHPGHVELRRRSTTATRSATGTTPAGTRILDEHGIGPLEFARRCRPRSCARRPSTTCSAHKGRVPIVVAARLGRITGLYQPAQSAHLDVYLENTEQWVVDLGLVVLLRDRRAGRGRSGRAASAA